MANWGEALQTFGRSVQGFAMQRLDREAQDINAMRIEAMRKLEMKHDEEMATARFGQEKELFGQKKQWDLEMEGREKTQRLAETKEEHAYQSKRDAAQFAQQSGLLDKKNLQDAIEAENRNLTAELTNFQDTRQSLQQQMAEMTDKGEVLDPAGAKAHQALLADLDVRERAARKNHLINTKRIMAGGYGKPEVLSAEDVAKIIAEKGPDTPSPPKETSPKPSPAPTQPAQAAPQQPKPEAPAGQPAAEESPELFGSQGHGAYQPLVDAAKTVGGAISQMGVRGGQPPPQQAAAPPQPPAQGRPAFSGFVDSVRSSLDATRGRMEQSLRRSDPFAVSQNELFPQQPAQPPYVQAAR